MSAVPRAARCQTLRESIPTVRRVGEEEELKKRQTKKKTEKCSFVSWSACWAHVRDKTKTLCREWIPKNCSALHLTADRRLIFYIAVQKINTDLLFRIWMNSVVQKKKKRGIVSFWLRFKKGEKGRGWCHSEEEGV